MKDAGTLVSGDALDDQILKDAKGLMDSLGAGSWVLVALFAAGLIAGLVKKFGLGVKKIDPPKVVETNKDLDKDADAMRALLAMKKDEKNE